MAEHDKREKKKGKKHNPKNTDNKNNENVEVKSEPEPKQKKNKKDKINTENIVEETSVIKPKKKRQSVTFTPETIDNEVETNDESPKKRKKLETHDETRLPTEEELEEIKKPENIKDVSSKRQKKRLKYEKLLADNKLKQDTVHQEKSLNYLSRWKHNRSEWKFEKLRQAWLQNHMFDSAQLPDKFFDIMVEYFGGSQGKIKQVLIETCMKIVDEAEGNEDAVDDVKFKRARTLLQFLHE